MRYENWKIVFTEQRAPGTLRVWAEPFTPLRVPKIFNLRADPYERADITSNTYYDWLIVPGVPDLRRPGRTWRSSWRRSRSSRRASAPASFSVDQVVGGCCKRLGGRLMPALARSAPDRHADAEGGDGRQLTRRWS